MKKVRNVLFAVVCVVFAMSCQQHTTLPKTETEEPAPGSEPAGTAELQAHLQNISSKNTLSQKEILALQHLQEDHATSEEDLRDMVLGLLRTSASARSDGAGMSVITGVTPLVSTIPNGFSSAIRNTRAEEAPIEPSEIPFYLFDLENPGAGTSGFAIACGDSRIGDVFAVVEEGAYDDPEAPFLGIFYSNLGAYIMDTVETYNSITEEDILEALEKVQAVEAEAARANITTTNPHFYDYDVPNPPRLKTTWNQRAPYWDVLNSVKGRSGDASGGKYLTGCVAVAMAQIMAFHQWPKSTGLTGTFIDPYTKYQMSFNNLPYPWADMTAFPDADWLNATPKRGVGILMYEIGKNVFMNYGTKISFAYERIMTIPAFEKMGYTASSFQSYSFDRVRASIDAKKPLFISAYATKETVSISLGFFGWFPLITYPKDGHSWVIDEYRVRTSGQRMIRPISTGTGGLWASQRAERIDRALPPGMEYVYYFVNPVYQVYCNFGWGGSHDGWYASGIFNRNTGPVDPTPRSTSTEGTAGYYQYDIAVIPNITPIRYR